MKIGFPSKHFEPIEPAEVADANLMGVSKPRALDAGNDPRAVLDRGFAHPIGAPRLREPARVGDRVPVLVDDDTRGTPEPAWPYPDDWPDRTRSGPSDSKSLPGPDRTSSSVSS